MTESLCVSLGFGTWLANTMAEWKRLSDWLCEGLGNGFGGTFDF
jgi:hypothetical protein